MAQIWTPPAHVGPGDASSDQFNAETVDNLLHLFGRIQAGTVADAGDNTAAKTGSVVFPVAFAAAPVVVLGVRTSAPVNMTANYTSNPSASGFGYRVRRTDEATFTAAFDVHWIAFGVPL